MTRRLVWMRILAVLTILLTACNVEPPENFDHMKLRVMTFNIEWGGKHVSFQNVIEAIRISGADIVGIQEAEGNLEELATALGWHFDERNYVISRFPVYDPPAAKGRYAYVEVMPGKVIAIANVHLPDAPYGPDLIAEGRPRDEVLANEHRVRVSWLSAWLDQLQVPVAKGIPTFVTGDFNSPSHNDSSDIAWPVTVAMEEAGFVDVWRVVHPDVGVAPGMTWWAARPKLERYAPGEGDPEGRIDMIWSSPEARPLAAELAGEAGRADVSYGVDPWPSDHRAVVVEFDVEPAPMPDILTTGRRVYAENERMTLRFNISEAGQDGLIVRRADRSYEKRYALEDESAELNVPVPDPGTYVVSTTSSDRELSRQFWVLAKDAVPAIDVSQSTFEPSSPVSVRWSNGPGFRNDYIAVYPSAGADDNWAMLHYIYIDASPFGEIDLRAAITAADQELSSGEYVVKLMKDDGYTPLAQSEVFVVE